MTDLGPYLERLGLAQYLNAFVGEGFDTWETVLDIQETDLWVALVSYDKPADEHSDQLNVRLGHRRVRTSASPLPLADIVQKLQRAIAEYRGVPYERVVAPRPPVSPGESVKGSDAGQLVSSGPGGTPTGAPEPKRKYRRHPKPDENAPERPPSAYVIFSNKVREEVKEQNLSFTKIAKLVGDRWQKLDPTGKEPYEAQANAAKERYNIQLSAYKKTDASKEYAQYLADFKAKHGGPSESKRPKLNAESSGSIVSNASLEMQPDLLSAAQNHTRAESIGSMGSSTYQSSVPSLTSFQPPLLLQSHSQAKPLSSAFPSRIPTASSRGGTPPAAHLSGRSMGARQLSDQSSMSGDSPKWRSDTETLGRTASLSLGTPPSGTPPLPPPPTPSSSDYMSMHDVSRMRLPGLSNQVSLGSGGAPSGFGAGPPFPQVLPSPVTSETSWRAPGPDRRVYPQSGRSWQPPPLPTLGSSGGSFSLPPLGPSDRGPELNPQRILPPPRTSSTVQQASGFPPARIADSPFAFGQDSNQGFLARQSSNPSLDRSESDAADALAGLASAGSSQSSEARRPQR